MKKKRIIFDLDGTLIDQVDYRDAARNLYEYQGTRFTEEDLEMYLTAMATYEDYNELYTFEDYYRHLCEHTNIPLTKDGLMHYLVTTELLCPKELLDIETKETLEYLKAKYDLVVLTNFFQSIQAARMQFMGIDKYFTRIYGAEQYRKPNPMAFKMAMGFYRPEECIMIGDSQKLDIEGAKSVNLDSIKIGPNRKEDIKNLRKKL